MSDSKSIDGLMFAIRQAMAYADPDIGYIPCLDEIKAYSEALIKKECDAKDARLAELETDIECLKGVIAYHERQRAMEVAERHGASEPVGWVSLTPSGKVAYFDGKPMFMPGVLGNECHPTPLYAARPPAAEQAPQPANPTMTREELVAAAESIGMRFPEPAARVPLTDAGVEFFRAAMSLSNTLGHPDATPEDENRAEQRYDVARDAMRAAIAQQPARTVTVEELPPLPEPTWHDSWHGKHAFTEEQFRLYAAAALRKFGIEVQG